MAITSRSKRPLNRGIPHLRNTLLIIIATEGEKTEKQYFESDLFHSLRVQVKVLGTEDGLSAPNHVIKRLYQFAIETDLQSDDQLWLMVDKDHWTERMLSDVCSQANRSRVLKLQTAISNPSFELWLYLHHDDWTSGQVSSKDMEIALRKKLGFYNKSQLNIDRYRDRDSSAVERARELDKNPDNRWPDNPGTYVYRVVEEIRKLEGN